MWLLLFLLHSLASADDVRSLVIGVNYSQTMKVPALARVSVGNEKIVRARAVPPSHIILTGVKPGVTTLRAWDEAGKEQVVEVHVVDGELYQASRSNGIREVIHVSLEFLELNNSNGEKLGIQWPDSIGFSSGGSYETGQNTTGLNTMSHFVTAQGWIHFLVQEGYARLLANPDLYVRLGEEASFHSGGELPIATAVEDYGHYYRRVEWKSFGLSVKVRPQSVDNLNFSSDVKIEISEPNPNRAVDGIPALNKRTLETKMRSEEGETVILSGLTRQVDSGSKNGIPGLSSIPILGLLFKSRAEDSEQTEIFMAMTLSYSTRSVEQEQMRGARERVRNGNR